MTMDHTSKLINAVNNQSDTILRLSDHVSELRESLYKEWQKQADLEQTISELRKENATLSQPQSPWIRTDEALPPKTGCYWITDEYFDLSKANWYGPEKGWGHYVQVIAWAYLSVFKPYCKEANHAD